MNYPANERLYKQYVLNFNVMRCSLRVLLDEFLLLEYPNTIRHLPIAMPMQSLLELFPLFFLSREKKTIDSYRSSAPGILITREQYIHG